MNKRVVSSCLGNGKDFSLFIKVAKKLIIQQYGFFSYFFMSNIEKAKLFEYWFRRIYSGEFTDLPFFLKSSSYGRLKQKD